MDYYSRRYVQFNDLVIDGFEMLGSADLSGSFKTNTSSYSFTHGSYVGFKKPQLLSEEQSLSLTLDFNLKKIDRTYRNTYRDFINSNIVKPGRIWAVQGNQLLWAWAFVDDFSEVYEHKKNTFSIDLGFTIYEGYWHKADTYKTYLKPYDICNFLDAYYIPDQNCLSCCSCEATHRAPCQKCLDDCEHLTRENALCANKSNVSRLYGDCAAPYQILYNCEAAEKNFGVDALGEKVCKEESCNPTIAGQFYSDTVLDTENITITIIGTANNPEITINWNTMVLEGEYNGKVTIYPNGDVYYQVDECCTGEWLQPNVLTIPDGSTLGYVVHSGENSILLETHDCCVMTCVYIDADSITI